jgi:hypothetical protein
MKNLKIGLALIAAVIAMSFTVVSRSGVSKVVHYTPESNCYATFVVGTTTYNGATTSSNGDFTYTTNPTSAGCSVATSNVKQSNSSKPLSGDFLNNAAINPVASIPAAYTGKCDETLTVVCCFHINPNTFQILDVCSGKQVAN